MAPKVVSIEPKPAYTFNILCSPYKGSWRVHAHPAWVPRYLLRCFDDEYEAYPVQIDLDDLDRYMKYHQAAYEKRVSTFGDTELTATGNAADALAAWLSVAMARA